MNQFIGAVIFKVGAEDLMDYLPEVLIILAEVVLCSIIGLKQGF